MIHIQNLSKSFSTSDTDVVIFSGLTLRFTPGSFSSIIGPSGSGKSTFLNLVSGIDRDYSGSIEIAEQKIEWFSDSQMTQFRGKNISYIFQNFKLIENLTVRENIDLVIELNNLERNFETEEILKIVGLSEKINTYVYNLSGGESQRVAIARAFVGKTQLLLADEPTGALDVANKNIIMDLILELHTRIKNTIIVITHDDEVAKLWKDIYKVSGGWLQKITL